MGLVEGWVVAKADLHSFGGGRPLLGSAVFASSDIKV